MPGLWKMLPLALKTYRRLPPAQRRAAREQATKIARTHGPAVAKAVGALVKQSAKRPKL